MSKPTGRSDESISRIADSTMSAEL